MAGTAGLAEPVPCGGPEFPFTDPGRSSRVLQAMLGMAKIDIAGLRAAYEAE